MFNGELISNKNNLKSEVLKFDQLDVDLSNLQTTTIKKPKIQETSTLKLIICFIKKTDDRKYCSEDFNKEIISTLSRRLIIPFYIPVISLCCALLLIKTKKISKPIFDFFLQFCNFAIHRIRSKIHWFKQLFLFNFYYFSLFAIDFNLYFLITLKFSKENRKYE